MRTIVTAVLALTIAACSGTVTTGGDVVDDRRDTADVRLDLPADAGDDTPGRAKDGHVGPGDAPMPDADLSPLDDAGSDPVHPDPAPDPAPDTPAPADASDAEHANVDELDAPDLPPEPTPEATPEPAPEPVPEPAPEVVDVVDTSAPPTPGVEQAVNLEAGGDQLYPAATTLSDGRFVVVFQSTLPSGKTRALLRCLDAQGVPTGPEAEIDADATADQERPAVAAVDDGGFVVAWHAAEPGAASDVFARRFEGCGLPHGAAERVNAQAVDSQGFASVASLPSKGVAVAWQTECHGFPCAELDGSWSGVFTRRLAWSAATPVEQLVNVYTMGQQENADVAPLPGGGWLVTWASLGQVGTGWDVYTRRFGADDAPLGGEKLVNAATEGLQSESDAALLADGRVVVAWMSRAQDGSGGDVLARLLAVDGIPQGDAFELARHGDGVQTRPAVAALPGGGFVAGWDDDTLDGAGRGVVARLFGADGTPLADEAVLNATTTDDQRLLDLTPDAHGGWLAVWASRGQDGSGWGIVARRFVVE